MLIPQVSATYKSSGFSQCRFAHEERATRQSRRNTNLLQAVLHNLGSVVDSQHNILDTNGSQSLNLVHNHGLVCELDQGLGQSQGLGGAALLVEFRGACSIASCVHLHGAAIGACLACRILTYKRAKARAEAADENEGCSRKTMVSIVIGIALCKAAECAGMTGD